MMKRIVPHPFLLAIYFVLFLFVHNINDFSLNVIFIPIVFVSLFALLLWFLLLLILKNGNKTGLITSLFILLFFSYGHFYDFFDKLNFITWNIGTNNFLFLVFVIPIFIAGYLIIRSKRNFDDLTKLLNISAIFFVCIPLFKIGTFYLNKKDISNKDILEEKYKKYTKDAYPPDSKNIDELPNIYYILLDAYGRNDLFKDVFNYDNNDFTNYLTSKGFYIANKCRSNYRYTVPSLSASMNLNYIPKLFDNFDAYYNSKNAGPMIDKIKDSYAVKFLKRYGYKVINFETGLERINGADLYMTPGLLSLNEFQDAIFETTLLGVVNRRVRIFNRRGKILYTLDHIGETTKLKGPFFVFAHILALHSPFLFGNLEKDMKKPIVGFMLPMKRKELWEYYQKSLEFLNQKVKIFIDQILSNSTREPIIVIFGDHGPLVETPAKVSEDINIGYRIAFENLNSYYLPNGGNKLLYDTISPVNTFRVIFNHYFGTNFELLKDESYNSLDIPPYRYRFKKIDNPQLASTLR